MIGTPTTYSFLDLSGSIIHPNFGVHIFTGEGIGTVGIAMATERAIQNRAADGSVMTSILAGQNGTVTITVQQTSAFHKWMVGLYDYLLIAGTSQQVQLTGLLRNVHDGSTHACMAGAIQKMADKSYQEQGQMVSWSILFANILTENVI